jgi:hypothetical protein
LEKFERGLKGLIRHSDKLRNQLLQVSREAVKASEDRIKRINELKRQHTLYKSAAQQTAIIAATKMLERLQKEKTEKMRRDALEAERIQQEAFEKLKQEELKRAEEELRIAEEELEMRLFYDAEDQEEIFDDPLTNNIGETSKNRYERHVRELHRRPVTSQNRELVESNVERFMKAKNGMRSPIKTSNVKASNVKTKKGRSRKSRQSAPRQSAQKSEESNSENERFMQLGTKSRR